MNIITKQEMESVLIALKIQHDAMGALIEALLCVAMDMDEGQSQDCPHPPNQRINMSTMGTERWQCKLCGYQHEEVRT